MPALYGNSKGQAAGIALMVAGGLGFVVITAVAWAICWMRAEFSDDKNG